MAELLKQIAPHVTRAAVVQDAGTSTGAGLYTAIQTVASSLGVQIMPIDVRDATGVEQALAMFATARRHRRHGEPVGD